MNVSPNNPVTIEDIEIAKQIFGSDIGSLKGKTTRQKPIPVVKDYIAIPEELYAKQQDIVLCIDGICPKAFTIEYFYHTSVSSCWLIRVPSLIVVVDNHKNNSSCCSKQLPQKLLYQSTFELLYFRDYVLSKLSIS